MRYRRVYRKLVVDLKVPFALKDGQRQDDTPVHEALREALVNALVHADYTGRVSVLVVKRPDMFGFRNPGGLRLPIEQVLRGGESDCRNRVLHQMFLLIGAGERGGSGMPRIYGGWRSQHWRPPALVEKDEPEQTLLMLHMADLLPEKVVAALRARFGARFDALDHTGRLVLAAAALERVVGHARLLQICGGHSHDLTMLLARLVRQGLLVSDGRSRGTVYFLPGESLPTPEQVFMGPVHALLPDQNVGSSSEQLLASSEHWDATSEHSAAPCEPLGSSSPGDRDALGRLVTALLDAPVIDELAHLDATFLAELERIAVAVRQGRPGVQQVQAVLLSLCRDQFMSLAALAGLVSRNPDRLRQYYLRDMVQQGSMVLAFPTKRTHEKLAYRAAPVKQLPAPESEKPR